MVFLFKSTRNLPAQLQTSDGFTLVELMVVVALVGILAGIAVPQYQKFQGRARQTEAKLALAGAYAAEKSFSPENQSYTACLRQAGYEPNGAKRYYYVGSQSLGTATCGPAGTSSCDAYTWGPGGTSLASCNSLDEQFPANATQSGVPVLFLPMPWLVTAKVTRDTFQLVAAGQISPTGPIDVWEIDENKNLKNGQSGI